MSYQGTTLYDVQMKGGGGGSQDLSHVFRFFYFQTKLLSFIFADGGGRGDTQLVIFCGRHKSMIHRWVNFRAPFLQVSLREKCLNTEFFSGPSFPVFGLNTEIYSVNFLIQSKYGKIRTRKNSAFGHFPTDLVVFFQTILKNAAF